MSSITKGEHEMIDALIPHGGFDAEWMEQWIDSDNLEGKQAVEAAQAQGYYRAIKAMVDAGFRTAWADNRKQMFK